MITSYHAKYYAQMLTQQTTDGDINSLSQSLLNAAVDINPHQIEAALFAFKSPLTKGVILADEVGLGKTIEAGLVLCQFWAISKRRIIVVCPAALRKQWSFELIEKFGIENVILDTKNYNEQIKRGRNPFAQKKVIICSFNFLAGKKDEVKQFKFDLAVIDEAHKLRNVYKKGSKTAQSVRDALSNVKKLLLTATPFQNSLMELYGLTSIMDDTIFGDSKSFRAEYVNEQNITDLQQRLKPYYKRTLRKDVTEYINFTRRLPMTQKFEATDLEQELYNSVSEFLRKDSLYAVPARQKMLTTMIIRKILASSSFALLGTLRTVKARLESLLSDSEYKQLELSDLLEDEELEVILEDEESFDAETDQLPDTLKTKIDIDLLKEEISQIDNFITITTKIKGDSKARALLQALERAFEQLPSIGAKRKALIFTESTRTQRYLKEYLEQNGYAGKIVLFNGSNSDSDSNNIFRAWEQNNLYSGKLSGILSADRRAAIVEYFRDSAEIMIATEAAAEGLNLQFCSLVVNYDLPWNPQRIEQRIGRCHRYGQKSDVVVVNFVNQRNFADMRVFTLLSEKFKLFDNVFGASDEILGQTDGADFERRIWSIYQECRTENEINAAFEKLQTDMQVEIEERLDEVKHQVLENFDIDVQERLKLAKEQASAFLNRYEYVFWELTKFILSDKAEFIDDSHTFVLNADIPGCKKGRYRLLADATSNCIPYRLSHPLAQYVLKQANDLNVGSGKVDFRPQESAMKVTLPEHLKNTRGYLQLSTLHVSAFDSERYSLLTAYTSNGKALSQEDCEKLFLCAGTESSMADISPEILNQIQSYTAQHIKGKLQEIDSRNLVYFREQEDRIFRWEKDLIGSIEHELDTVKRQIREQERAARSAQTIEETLTATRRVEELERQKRKKRNELATREDEIGDKRRTMIAELDNRMIKQTKTDDVFIVEWQVI